MPLPIVWFFLELVFCFPAFYDKSKYIYIKSRAIVKNGEIRGLKGGTPGGGMLYWYKSAEGVSF